MTATLVKRVGGSPLTALDHDNNLQNLSDEIDTNTVAVAANTAGVAANAAAIATKADSGANSDITSLSGLTTPLSIAQGGTDSATASAARTALGLAIGTDVQAYDAQLADVAGLAVTDGNFIVGDGANFVVESGATARTSLGLTIGTDVQAYDVDTAKLDVAQEWTQTQNFNETTLSDGATINWDLSANQVCKVTLAGNRTMAAPTNHVAGALYALRIIQDATGSRTLTWNAVFKFTNSTAPTLTTTASAEDHIVFRSDGTNLLEVGRSLNIG